MAVPIEVAPVPVSIKVPPVPIEVAPVPIEVPQDSFGQMPPQYFATVPSNSLNGRLTMSGEELILTYGESMGAPTPKDFDTIGRDQILLVFERVPEPVRNSLQGYPS